MPWTAAAVVSGHRKRSEQQRDEEIRKYKATVKELLTACDDAIATRKLIIAICDRWLK